MDSGNRIKRNSSSGTQKRLFRVPQGLKVMGKWIFLKKTQVGLGVRVATGQRIAE